MNIKDFIYLVALSDSRHFGKAAEACHVSQPTLSTQIKKLENELGIALVERDNKHVMLTNIGKEVVEQAKELLNNLDAIKNIAKQAKDPESGQFVLGVIPTIGPYLLPYAIKAIKKRFPNLTLYMHEAKTHELIEMLKSGVLDAAIMVQPIEEERFDYTPMYREAFFAALPMGHALSQRETLSFTDLEKESIMLLEDGHCMRDQTLDICQRAGAQESGEFRATSLETLRQMVISGTGVTLLPTLAAEFSLGHPQDLTVLPFEDPQPDREIGLFYRASSPRKTLFNEIANAICARLPKGLKQHLTLINQSPSS